MDRRTSLDEGIVETNLHSCGRITFGMCRWLNYNRCGLGRILLVPMKLGLNRQSGVVASLIDLPNILVDQPIIASFVGPAKRTRTKNVDKTKEKMVGLDS